MNLQVVCARWEEGSMREPNQKVLQKGVFLKHVIAPCNVFFIVMYTLEFKLKKPRGVHVESNQSQQPKPKPKSQRRSSRLPPGLSTPQDHRRNLFNRHFNECREKYRQYVESAQPPTESSTSEEICSICRNQLDDEVKLSCGHTFCAVCIRFWFAQQALSHAVPTCPLCKTVTKTIETTGEYETV